jgi:hypothetical protein
MFLMNCLGNAGVRGGRHLWGAMLSLVTLTMSASLAQAGIVFEVAEVGPDVSISVSGSIDTTGWSLQGITAPNVYIRGRNIAVGNTNMRRIDGNPVAVTGGASVSQVFPPLGSGIHYPVTGSAQGDTVIFQANSAIAWALFVPFDYVSNDSVKGKAKYANLSFAALGMTGHTNWKWYLDGNTGNDAKSVTVLAVPEPSTFVLGGIGLVAACVVIRRKSPK